MKQNIGLLILLSTVLTACVTINIYFPAAAAERVADQIIDDVWQLKQDGTDKEKAPAPTEPTPETK